MITIFRIIPTRVGTSYYIHNDSVRYEDHPHACGDKEKKEVRTVWTVGSSPRVWGQDVLKSFSSNSVRIIPTRVGTSRLRRIMSILRKDHPHACGDKLLHHRNI